MAVKRSYNSFLTSKAFLVILIFFAFAVGYVIARAKYKPQILELNRLVHEKALQVDKAKALANKIMMDEGKMWVVKNGIAKELESDLMMANGDNIRTDGVVVKADGTEVVLEEGDAMDMNGKMIEDEESK